MGTRVWGKFIVPKLRNRLVFCLSSLIDGLSCPGLPFLGPFYGFHDATVSQKRSSTNHFFEMFSDLFLSKNEVLGGPSFSMLFTGFSLSFHGLFTHFSRTFHAPKFQQLWSNFAILHSNFAMGIRIPTILEVN